MVTVQKMKKTNCYKHSYTDVLTLAHALCARQIYRYVGFDQHELAALQI
jgi:hypothetical protein